MRKLVLAGDRTFKLGSGTTSEPGRYVKSLGEPRRGRCWRGCIGTDSRRGATKNPYYWRAAHAPPRDSP